MILTITLSVFALVLFNFLLLKFSCNKIKRIPKSNKKPIVIKPRATISLESEKLAPTGS